MSELYELPNGWEWTSLDNISEFKMGYYFKSEIFKDDGLPIIRIKNIKDETINFNDLIYFNKSDVKDDIDRYLIQRNDLLIAMSGATTGKIGLYESDIEAYLNYRVGLIRIEDYILRQYVFSFLKTQIELNLERSVGAAQPNLSKEQIINTQIPLPPLSEQQRIVSKLDKLFEKIDKSIALHQKNMDEADVFMGSVLNDVFGELEEKYPTTKLAKIVGKEKSSIKRGPFGSALKKSFFVENGYKVYEQKNAIRDDFSLGEYYIDENKFNELKGFEVKGGDLIISCSGTIGKISVAPMDMEKGIINQALLKLTLNNDVIITKFFVNFWNNYVNNGMSEDSTKGAAIKNIASVAVLKELDIPYPPLQIQQKVVRYLDEISEKIEKVKLIQKEKMDSLKALKASILDKAFRGEL